MNGETFRRLAEMLMAMPEEERDALWASLAASRPSVEPTPRGPSRSLPAARTACVVTTQIEWT